MSEDKYIKEVGKRPLLRVMAWVGLIIIFALIILTLITGITGSDYFWGCLALTIIVSVFIYVALWIGRVLYNVGAGSREENNTTKATQDNK